MTGKIIDVLITLTLVAALCMQVDTWREVRKATRFIEAMHEMVREGAE